ncbi:MAG: hypothetical protein ACOH1N_13635 [Lutibacter sp.]
MVLNIIFSFNRAMQLDYFLTSGLARLKFPTETVIIFHTTGNHAKGYDKLIEKYSEYKHIRFVERTTNKLSTYLKIRLSKKQKQQYLKGDNFKELLEQIIRESSHDFVMFNTDDGIWIDDVHVSTEIFNLIKNNPSSASYRMYVGDNLEELPFFVKKWNGIYLWDYYAEERVTHWTYPFAIDGTIYNRAFISSFLPNLWLEGPIDLEESGVNYVKQKKLLGIGMSPTSANLIGTVINRVSTTSFNPVVNVSVDELNNYFLNDYTLLYELQDVLDKVVYVPEKIFIVKGSERFLLYKKDQDGANIQNKFGIEGTKK